MSRLERTVATIYTFNRDVDGGRGWTWDPTGQERDLHLYPNPPIRTHLKKSSKIVISKPICSLVGVSERVGKEVGEVEVC
jgi:hypothetical protein